MCVHFIIAWFWICIFDFRIHFKEFHCNLFPTVFHQRRSQTEIVAWYDGKRTKQFFSFGKWSIWDFRSYSDWLQQQQQKEYQRKKEIIQNYAQYKKQNLTFYGSYGASNLIQLFYFMKCMRFFVCTKLKPENRKLKRDNL